MEKNKIAVIGGDTRLAYMAAELAHRGYRVICYGTEPIPKKSPVSCCFAGTLQEALQGAQAVVGGIPFAKSGRLYSEVLVPDLELSAFCRALEKGQSLFGGVLPQEVRKACRKNQVRCCDFMQDEPLAVFNAVATAEGSILTALQHRPTTLHGSCCLVLGYGRCAKVLAEKLKGLSARVTVCARDAGQLACAAASGMDCLAFSMLEEKIGDFEYIFNTIPARVIGKEMLKKMKRNSLIVDIATGGGVDYEAAGQLGILALLCPGLPGKYAPRTSAVGMAEFVIRKME